jgi:hypothetical protein
MTRRPLTPNPFPQRGEGSVERQMGCHPLGESSIEDSLTDRYAALSPERGEVSVER